MRRNAARTKSIVLLRLLPIVCGGVGAVVAVWRAIGQTSNNPKPKGFQIFEALESLVTPAA